MEKIKGSLAQVTCTQKALAEAIGITPARINQLIDEEIVLADESDKSGAVYVFDSLKNYFLSKNVKGTGVDYWKERGLNERAKRQLNEVKLRQTEGELYEASEVEAQWAEILALLRNNLLGLPSKLSLMLEQKSREEIFERLTEEMEMLLRDLTNEKDQ